MSDNHTPATADEINRAQECDDFGGRYYVTSVDGSHTFAGPFADWRDADEAADQIERGNPTVSTDIRFQTR